jgi:hypothetical protein
LSAGTNAEFRKLEFKSLKIDPNTLWRTDIRFASRARFECNKKTRMRARRARDSNARAVHGTISGDVKEPA